MIFGETSTEVADVDAVEKRVVDSNWNAGKSWMSQFRCTSPMNNDMVGVGEYNDLIHKNNGVVVTQMHDKPVFDAPVVK